MQEDEYLQVQKEVDSAQELISQIDAMVNAPYWDSHRRETISKKALLAKQHLDKVKETLCSSSDSLERS
jgi:hypothetical protein